jgi:hypothetical protein
MSKFVYSELSAPVLSFELAECPWSNFSMVNQFFNEGVKDTKKKLSRDEVDPSSKDHHIYCVMEVDNAKYKGVALGKELQQLNSCKGFKTVINVEGNEFTIKPGAQMRVVGKTIEFRVAA